MSIFAQNEIAILSDKAGVDLPMRAGSRVIVLGKSDFKNYKYDVEFDDGTTSPVKETELVKLTEEDKFYMDYIFVGNNARSKLIGETVHIEKVDYINKKVEIKFEDDSCTVIDFNDLEPIEHLEQVINVNYFEQKGLEIGQLVNKKQVAYGDSISKAYKLMQVYLENYDNGNDTYTIPKSLLKHILLQIRIIDKQNRIFNNPDGDLMEENPYADTVGYGLLGMRMCDEQRD